MATSWGAILRSNDQNEPQPSAYKEGLGRQWMISSFDWPCRISNYPSSPHLRVKLREDKEATKGSRFVQITALAVIIICGGEKGPVGSLKSVSELLRSSQACLTHRRRPTTLRRSYNIAKRRERIWTSTGVRTFRYSENCYRSTVAGCWN